MKDKNHAEQEAKGGAAAPATTQAITAQAAPQSQAKAGGSAAGAGAGAALVSAPALQTPEAPALDAHHGKGGLYQLIDGQRVLVAQTQPVEV